MATLYIASYTVPIKQTLHMPPYVEEILDLRLSQSKAASGTFFNMKVCKAPPSPKRQSELWIGVLGKQTKEK